MRIILILFMFSFAILIEVESQEPAEVPPDVEVGEFSTSKFRTYEPITNSRSKTTNKTDTRTRSTIYQEEIRNRSSIENRSRDMLELEQDVMREAQNSKPTDMFRYRVSLKNTGLKMVKLVIWDYQASYTDDFADSSHRLFRCSAKIKPNQSERFEGFSILPPIRVVNAAETPKTFRERIVIDRIEYDDGSSWRRSTWHEPEVVASEGGRGNCKLL
jgi:hypothetical protein